MSEETIYGVSVVTVYVTYRKPRRISEDVKEHRRIQMKNINKSQL